MWLRRLVWREFRSAVGRLVTSVAAVAIAVALLVGTQAAAATEFNASASREAIYLSQADVVVQSHLWRGPRERHYRDALLDTATKALQADPDVTAVASVGQLYTQLTAGDKASGAMLTSVPDARALSWLGNIQGRPPTAPDEIVLTRQAADELAVDLGGRVRAEVFQPVMLTVVGIAPERGYADAPAYVSLALLQQVDREFPPPKYNVIIDPATTRHQTPGSSGDGIGLRLLAKTRSPAQAAAVTARVQAALTKAGYMHVLGYAQTAAAARADITADVAGRPQVTSYVMTGSSLVALVICAMLISTTFSIFAAQRQRRGSYLRAVGATRGQLLALFELEALVVGTLGSILGLLFGVAGAAAATAATQATRYGFVVPGVNVGLAAVAGILTAQLAALAPGLRFAGARPLETGAAPARPYGIARAARVLVLVGTVVAGLALCWLGADRVAPVAAGLGLLTIAALVTSSFWVLLPTRALSRALPRTWAVARLGCGNIIRAPRRAASAAGALALATGLLASVQVGAVTGSAAAYRTLDERYGADIILASARPEVEAGNGSGLPSTRDSRGELRSFSSTALATVRSVAGVREAQEFDVTETVMVQNGLHYMWIPFVAMPPSAHSVLRSPLAVHDGEIGLDPDTMQALSLHAGDNVDIAPLSGEPLQLRAVPVGFSSQVVLVTDQTLTRIHTPTHPGLIVVQLTDQDRGGTVLHQLQAKLAPTDPGIFTGGSAEPRAAIRTQLAGLTTIFTMLLGIGILVAMLGVGNTLALSALERARETTLLRALGLSRAAARQMLTVEALLLSASGLAVGIAGGILAGWRLSVAVAAQFHMVRVAPQIEPPTLAALASGVLVASLLASVFPGSRRQLPLTSPED